MKLNPFITLAIVVLAISQAVQAWVAIQPTPSTPPTLQQQYLQQVHEFCEGLANTQEGTDQRTVYIGCWKRFK